MERKQFAADRIKSARLEVRDGSSVMPADNTFHHQENADVTKRNKQITERILAVMEWEDTDDIAD